MKINETTLNCCKPKRFTNFTGAEHSNTQERKIHAKHFYQMNDEALQLRSVLKAHKDVQESGKMRLFKAMPVITTGLLGLTIGLAQPGKLAAKAGAGLGFLALSEVVNNVSNKALDKFEKNQQEGKAFDVKKALLTIAKVAAGIGAIALGATVIKNTKTFKNINTFVAKELKQLSSEINKTKLAKKLDKTFAPFAKKHARGLEALGAVAPWGVIVGSSLAEATLFDSLSNDVKEKSIENYQKGKMVQTIARAHYDSINAPEMV